VPPITMRQIVETDGELLLRDLSCRKGQEVEVTLQVEDADEFPLSTGRHLASSKLVGLWKDRTDIGDSSAYARELREKLQAPRYKQR